MNFTSFEFSLLILSIIATLSLVVIVLRYSPKNQSRIFFVLFGLSLAIWQPVNFFAIHADTEHILNMARWALTAATPLEILLFLFIITFLRKVSVIKPIHGVLATVVALFVMGVARSPYLFTHVEWQDGQATPLAGGGMAVFGFYAFVFVALAFMHLFRSWHQARGETREQWKFVGIGLLTTFALLLSFNFLVAILLDTLTFVRFGNLYVLPFVFFTTYAMVKHRLFDIKAILAELAVVLLVALLFIQFFGSPTGGQFLMNGLILAGVIIVGMLLVQGVKREVRHREQLQKLTEELKGTNKKLDATNRQLDITNKKLDSANKELEKLDKAKTEFLSITSHQLRTPLTGIKGYLSMMLEGDFGKFTDQQDETVKRVAAEVDRLARMVQVFLNVSRIESGRLIVAKLDFNIAELINTVVKELKPLAENKKLELSYTGPVSLPYKGDSDKLKDVVMNLVDNSIKYTPSGKVWVEASQVSSGDIHVSVKDTGVGIDPSETGKLFEKFSRAKGIAEVSAEGSGLGLFIVKKIVEAHGGSVSVASEGHAKGSVFSFVLPKVL